MSLRAGRVGVAPSEVDSSGHIIGGGSGGDSYTKAETDTLLAAKANKSYITANNKIFQFAYDSQTQKYGYKAGAQGEFHPFESAGGVVGMNLPEATMTGVDYTGYEYVEGGYQVVHDNTLNADVAYADIILHKVDGINITFPFSFTSGDGVGVKYVKSTLNDVKKFMGPAVLNRVSSSSPGNTMVNPAAGGGTYIRLLFAVSVTLPSA